MLSVARQLKIYENTAITCDGNEYGEIFEIGGLGQKCQAAGRQGWNIIIAKSQDRENGDNNISNIPPPPLLWAKTIQEAMTHLKSGIGFEVIDYLELVYERLGKLPLDEKPPDCPKEADFDNIIRNHPIKVDIVAGENGGITQDWENGIYKNVRRAVIYIREQIGKTRLLRYEGRKISRTSVSNLEKGTHGRSEYPDFPQMFAFGGRIKRG